MDELERIQKSFLRIADIGISKEEIKKLITILSNVANMAVDKDVTETVKDKPVWTKNVRIQAIKTAKPITGADHHYRAGNKY